MNDVQILRAVNTFPEEGRKEITLQSSDGRYTGSHIFLVQKLNI
jgi:hypothetical protein